MSRDITHWVIAFMWLAYAFAAVQCKWDRLYFCTGTILAAVWMATV